MASDGPAPHPIPRPCVLALPSRSHQDAATPSLCWAPDFSARERLMFSNPTPSEPHLSPAATMNDDMLSALTPPLPCASILQPATPPQVVAFESWDHLCSNLSQSFHSCCITETRSLNLCMCFIFSCSAFTF